MCYNDLPKSIEQLRSETLFHESNSVLDGTTFAAHHYLSALALLEQARCQAQLACMFAARELAGNL